MIVQRMHASLRGRNVLINIIEMWVALAGVISGLIFVYRPASIDQNALSQTIGHNLAATWSISYAAAGVIIWFGLLRPSPRWEVVGLFLLGSATSVNGLAIVSVFGLRGAATAATLLTLTLATWLRASFVMRTALRLVEESHVSSG